MARLLAVGSGQPAMKRWATVGIVTALVVLSVARCTTSDPIYLKSANGKTVRCGPYMDFGYLPATSKSTEAKVWDCVSYYQRNGYERIPSR